MDDITSITLLFDDTGAFVKIQAVRRIETDRIWTSGEVVPITEEFVKLATALSTQRRNAVQNFKNDILALMRTARPLATD